MGWRERKQEKRKKVWIGVFMALLMIFSGFGIYLGSVTDPEQDFEYNEHSFKAEEGRYIVKVNNFEVPFYNLPYDIEDINLSSEATALIKNAWVPQIVFDPEQESLEYIELTRFDWSTWWGKPILSGVVKESTDYPTLPVLSCANATPNGPVIYLNSTPDFTYHLEGNCLILNALGADFLRWRDRVLYTHLRILK